MTTPFKSKAQIEHFRKLVAKGAYDQKAFDEALAATPDHENLPERLHPKKPAPTDTDPGPRAA
jgi:hypothetical protein